MDVNNLLLGDIVKLITGKTPPTKEEKYFNGSVNWLTPSDFKTKYVEKSERTVSTLAIVDKKVNVVNKNSLFVTCIGNVGKVIINRETCTSNQQITALEVKNSEDLIIDYLYYWFIYNQKHIESKANKAVVSIINNKILGEVKIKLPPLSTQKAIAEKLDKADALRKKDKELLAQYDELAQAIFIDMFGDPVKNEKGWKIDFLKNMTLKIGSGSTPKGGKENYKSEGISLIRSMNVYDRQFLYRDLAYIDENQAEKLKNVIVESGDILFNITGASVCRSSIVPDNVLPARVNQHVSLIRPKLEYLNNHYLSNLLISDNVKQQLLKIGSGGGAVMEAITKEQLENYKIIIPPLNLQIQFAEKIQNIEAQKALLKQQAQQSEDLFQALLQESFNF